MSRSPTPKEAEMLKQYLNPASPTYLNATRSAEKVYNTTSDNTSANLGHRVVKRLEDGVIKVKKKDELSQYLRENLTEEHVLSSILKIAKGESPKKEIKLKGSDITKAWELLSKYRGFNGLLKDSSIVETKDTPPSERELDLKFTQLLGDS